MKTLTVIELDYTELDDLVNKNLRLSKDEYDAPMYEYLCNEEAMNDTEKKYNGINGFLNDEDLKRLGRFRDNPIKEMYMTYVLLNYLCNIKAIKSGDYLITVSH